MVAFMMASKSVYTAEMVEILDEFNLQESVFTLPITVYFIVYAVTQLILAVFFHKLNVKLYLILTVALSCVLCLYSILENVCDFCTVI